MRRQTVVVVGAGCSGALVTSELLRRTAARVVLVDPADAPGRGVAYGAAAPWHLLNSPVSAMSAHPDEPAHFLDWCRRRSAGPVGPGDFLSRRRYGDYLGDVLDAAAVSAPGRLTVRRAWATDVRPTGVTLADGGRLGCDQVVLALGPPPAADPPGATPALRHHRHYVADPWAPGALDAVPPGRPVLLVGTGLTAVDVALSLRAGDHRAPVHAVSRHGLLPQPHRRPGPPVGAPGPLPAAPPSLSAAVRDVRSRIAAGADWRALVDGLRPELDARWARLDRAGQDRFLRHLARYWEVHRHRMAPAVADRVDRLRAEGALIIRSATVGRIAGRSGGLDVTLNGRVERFGAVVNCTGPGRLPGAAGGLVARLLADGSVRPGPHGLGLDVAASGAPYDRRGRPAGAVWIVGPLRRGRLWETTAVPEIRSQVAELGLRLAGAPAGSAVAGRPAVPGRSDALGRPGALDRMGGPGALAAPA